MSLTALDEQVGGIERLVSSRRGLQISAFLLFADSYLLLFFQRNLFSLDWEWAKSHLGLGGAAAAVFFFLFFAGLVAPLVYVFTALPSYIGSELLLDKWAENRGEWVKGVSSSLLLNFAIAEDNGVAYQEYLRQQTASAEYIESVRWNVVFLCSVGMNASASKGPAESLLEMLWATRLHMPAWLFYIAVTACSLFLLMLTASVFISLRFMGSYHWVSPELCRKIRAAMLIIEKREPDSDIIEEVETAQPTCEET